MSYLTGSALSFNQPKLCSNASWNLNGTIFAAAYSLPYGIFVDANNTVYSTNQATAQIQVWSSEGVLMQTMSNDLINPAAIFVTINSDIYVDNGGNLRVEQWVAGATTGVVVMNTTAQCMGLFIDTNNTLYCSASNVHQVIATSLNAGQFSVRTVVGTGDSGSASNQLYHPNGIFVDIYFNLYVADFDNNRIQKFQPGETVGQTVVGTTSPKLTFDLNSPIGVVLDGNNYLFVSDLRNNRIIGSSSNGFRCIAGCSEVTGSLVSQLNTPRSLAFDSYGNLFVVDRRNDRIMKFTLTKNSCDSPSTVTTPKTTTTIETTSKMTTAITTQQFSNGFFKTNKFQLHLILCPTIATFQTLF